MRHNPRPQSTALAKVWPDNIPVRYECRWFSQHIVLVRYWDGVSCASLSWSRTSPESSEQPPALPADTRSLISKSMRCFVKHPGFFDQNALLHPSGSCFLGYFARNIRHDFRMNLARARTRLAATSFVRRALGKPMLFSCRIRARNCLGAGVLGSASQFSWRNLDSKRV